MMAGFVRRVAVPVMGLVASLSILSVAAADDVYIRNPLWVGSQITSDWSHASGYGETALDMVYANGGTTGGAGVYWRADNVDPTLTKQVYYEVYDYGTSCTGARYEVYTHPTGTTPYSYVGSSKYVHMSGYPTGGSYNINPGTSHAYLIGSVATSQPGCTWSGPHLHHGRNASDGFNYAYWLTSSVASGSGADVGSEEITLYK